MRKGKKIEINEDDLPEIKRLIVPVNMVNVKNNIDKISEIFEKRTRKDTIIISRKSVLEYAEENELYIDLENVDPKKKIPEDVPTKLTTDLKHELYRKFIKEQDLQGRLHKRECIDAKDKGKPVPSDPRFEETKKKEIKKKPKRGKNEPEEEEEKELEDDTVDLEGDFDYVYILLDYGVKKEEMIQLFGFKNIYYCTCLVEGVFPPPKKVTYDEQLDVLNSQIFDPKKFEEDYRKRINQYIEGEFEKPSMSEEEKSKYNQMIEKFTHVIEELVRKSSENSCVSSWKVFQTEFNFENLENVDKEIDWGFYFRNTIFKAICDFSNKLNEYVEFVRSLKLYKLVDNDPEIIKKFKKEEEEKLLKAEEERLAKLIEDQEKNDKKKKKKKDKKPAKKRRGRKDEEEEEKLRKQKEEEERLKEEEEKKRKEEEEASKEKETKSEIIFEPFATFNTQLSTLENDQLAIGCFLEAFIDELSKREKGFVVSQQPKKDLGDKYEETRAINEYLKATLTQLSSNKMVDHLSVIFKEKNIDKDTTNLHSSSFSIFKDMDHLSKILGNTSLHNHDDILPRVKLILDEIKFKEIEELVKITQKKNNVIEKKLETTVVHSSIKWNIEEFIRKQHLIKMEKIFREQENLKLWDFSERIYTEELDEFSLKQKLIEILKDDPNMISHYEEKLGLLYLGFYFKTPPGRCYYKQWLNDDNLIPGYKKWDIEFRGKKEVENETFFNISEEEIGDISEKRSLFFPTDGGIIDVTNYSLKFKNMARIVVKKSRMIFGIKEPYIYMDEAETSEIELLNRTSTVRMKNKLKEEKESRMKENQSGLIEDKLKESVTILEQSLKESEFIDQGCEFWYTYDSGTRMHIEMEEVEIDSKTHAFETKIMKGKKLPIFEMKAQITFSLMSGIVVKLNGNRDVLMFSNFQKKVKPNKLLEAIGLAHFASADTYEFVRIITEEGAVIKKMSDGKTIIMHPDGKMNFSRGGNQFKTIEIDGTYIQNIPNEEEISISSLKNLKSTKKIDPDTGITSIVREDRMVSFIYPDGTKIFNFPDNTKIRVSSDSSNIKIEHPDYPTFVTKFDKFRARNPPIIGHGSSFASKGKKNIFDRSYTGRITTLYLKDGTMMRTYQEMRELPGYNKYKLVNISLVYGYDSSICKVESTGEVVALDALDFTGVNRTEVSKMNVSTMSHGANYGGKSRIFSPLGKSLDIPIGLRGIQSEFFIQLFLKFQEREQGVYTVNLREKTLQTMDKQGNVFKVRSDGKVSSKIAISFNLEKKKEKWDKFPKFKNSEYIDPENYDLPIPENWRDPHLFLIRKDKTATTFYSEGMLSTYWGQKSLANSRIVTVNDEKTKSTGMLILTKETKEHGEKNEEYNSSTDQFIQTVPNSFKPLPPTTLGKFEEEKKKFSLRILKKFGDLTTEDRGQRNIVKQEVEKYKNNTSQFNESKVVWDRSKEQVDEEFDIQQKIMCLHGDNILVYNQSNRDEIGNTENVLFVSEEKTVTFKDEFE